MQSQLYFIKQLNKFPKMTGLNNIYKIALDQHHLIIDQNIKYKLISSMLVQEQKKHQIIL